jgi:GT2 family glycosyltransferase
MSGLNGTNGPNAPNGPRSDDRVSIVMLTHNRVEEVTSPLQHLLDLPERVQIVVVDNGSVDGTALALATRFPEIEVIRLQENVGAAARNIGIRRVRTPYVALCDDDTWWAPGSLTRAADLLDRHPRLAIITGRVLVRSEQREDETCARMAASPLPSHIGMPGSAILGFLAGASMIRRSAFLAVGGFEARFFIGGEESLVAVDLAAAGWAMAYIPDVVIHHHPSARRDSLARRRLLIRNHLWFTWLRRPGRTALRETCRSIPRVLRDPVLRQGLAQALAGLPWILRYRRVVPAHVEAALRQVEGQSSSRIRTEAKAGQIV